MMRGGKGWIVLAGAAAIWGAAARAEEEETPLHIFPDKFFAIDFPSDPKVSTGTYDAVTPVGSKVQVPATIYSVQRQGALYQVTVADFANSPAGDKHALDYAVADYRKRSGLELDTAVSHSLNGSRSQLCGRHFGYLGPKGQLNYQTLYYNPNTSLFYDVVSSVTEAAQPLHGADAEHFQTSLSLQADPKSKELSPPPDYPENWQVRKYPDARFEIRFPAEPTVEEGNYTTDGGIVVPATRYWVRTDDALYRLTVATYWGTPADPDGPTAEDAVDGAVRLWQRQGTVLTNDSVAIGNGQCGRDVTLRTAEGLQARASIYFPATQHKIYIVEVAQQRAAVAVDPLDDRRFRESLTLATAM